MLTLSAPAGAGKTSFSYALIVAVTRNAEQHPEAPYGAVFVVDQISKADDAYSDLNALLPGKKAVRTTEHKKRMTYSRVKSFGSIRLIVVTNQFYLRSNGSTARNVIHNRSIFRTTGPDDSR